MHIKSLLQKVSTTHTRNGGFMNFNFSYIHIIDCKSHDGKVDSILAETALTALLFGISKCIHLNY